MEYLISKSISKLTLDLPIEIYFAPSLRCISFVIFINVPYDLEEEDKFFPEKKDPKTSRLCFVMNSPMGVPEEVAIPVDKGFEGKMLLFDAKLPHMVYPFYTSDGERITASGNVVYEREPF